jgi:hypothetical protein
MDKETTGLPVISRHSKTPTRIAVRRLTKYKAVGGLFEGGLWAMTSPDSIHWELMGKLPVRGNFDSQNVVFWDAFVAVPLNHERGNASACALTACDDSSPQPKTGAVFHD